MANTHRLMYESFGESRSEKRGPAQILIVDDEESDRLFGQSILEAAGHQLLFAPHGEIALRIYETHEVDVVITDLAMPRLNGIQLIEELMERDADACVIAVSGVSPKQLDTASRLGAVHTLVKPYTPEDLLAAVDAVLTGPTVRPPDDLWG